MIAYFDVEQKTSEWHELKYCKIGGTRAKQLFVKGDTLFFELLAESIEPYCEMENESFVSDAMERGNELEPIARELLGKTVGVEFIEVGWLQHSNIPLLGISPDGISKCLKYQCEIKCPQSVNHLKIVVSKQIPLGYINQCVQAFAVNDKLEKFYFGSYRPECSVMQLFYTVLTRDSLVNNGTEAKPVMVLISDLVKETHTLTEKLQTKINQTINNLNF